MVETLDKPGAKHASFTIERKFKAPPKRVFAAWATLEAKQKWFAGGEGWTEEVRGFDFREGGSEELVGRKKTGTVSAFFCRYWEIIPDQRIVYAYDMHLDGVRISVSLATIELRPEGTGTHMTLTEQGAYLVPYDPDGDDHGSRLRGTTELIDRVVKYVDGN
ncbi:MAG: SRPBCC family protein [Hyphomonadaceae bacterium]|nr:SRPBCC family protein [Hyphomonadaceae bacterium]